MPVFTDPPVLVDPVAFSRQSRAEENKFIFQHLAIQYLVLVPGTTGSNGLGVFVSTDDGLTWAEADAANKPTDTPRNPATFYNSGAGTLEIFYENASGHAIVTFTLAGLSSTWGTPGANLTDGLGNAVFFAQKSDNSYVLFVPNLAGNHIVYYTNTAGVWSSATNIFAGSFTSGGTGVKGGAISTTDVSFFTTIDNSTSAKIHRVDAAFSITSHTLGGALNTRTSVLLDEANDNVVVNWNGNQEIYADIGTPLSAPTYTHYTLFSEGGSSSSGYPFLVLDADGKYNTLFVQVDYSTDPITDLLWQTVFDGISAWSTPVVYYDEVANPPADSTPDQLDQFIHTGDAVLLASGHLLVTIALETVDAAVDHCTGFVLAFAPTPPPTQSLRLEKTVSGGTADPSMWLLTGTGSSQTVSGAGDTGVVAVTDPQTFELTESTGPDGYTAGAWDCGDALMPTPTSVVVNEAGASSNSPVQIPTDATFRPLLSNGDTHFSVGGNEYSVEFNSAGRLGMFTRATALIGGPWSELDSAGAPTNQSGYGHALIHGTSIAVCYIEVDNVTTRIVEFSTGGATWGTPTAAITQPSSTQLFGFVRRSDSTYVFIGAYASHWYYVTNTTGTWGSITNLNNTAGTVVQAIISPANQIWFTVNYTFASDPNAVGLFPLSSTYVLGAAVSNRTLFTDGPPFPFRFYPDIAFYGTTDLAFAYTTATTPMSAGSTALRVSIIRNYATAPVLHDFLAYITTAGQLSCLFDLVDDSGVLNMFWVNQESPRNQIYQSHWDDPFNWTAPTVFYDAVTDPPPSPTSPTDFGSMQAKKEGGGWNVATTMLTTGDVPTAEFIEEVTSTGIVVCTITNTFGATTPFSAQCPSPIYVVGTPYSSFVTVTGGTPPYTFAVTSGSLPTGLSLNASTGEVSGTPSADGPFDFTITVTDDDGNTTTTGGCSAGRCPGTRSLL